MIEPMIRDSKLICVLGKIQRFFLRLSIFWFRRGNMMASNASNEI
jgi:hypothetical protein